jgi:hypothetical protein
MTTEQQLFYLAGMMAMCGMGMPYQTTPAQGNMVKHLAIREGGVNPPKRATMMDRYRRQARDLGLDRKGAR